MCVGLPKTAEHLFLAAFFFASFFCASKRKKMNCIPTLHFIRAGTRRLTSIKENLFNLILKNVLAPSFSSFIVHLLLRRLQTKKTAPLWALNNTKQALRISVRSKNVFTILKIVHVRWLAKNSGAFVFGCPFLCFFLLGKQKKEKDKI